MYNWDVFKRLNVGEQSLVKWQFKEHGGFWTALWEAICKADDGNLKRLESAYPLEVLAYRRYIGQMGWWENLLEQLRKPEVINGGKKETGA